MIYDCFIFDDELMMLEIRLNTLADVVDKFILVESTHTFTGMEKKLCYLAHQDDPALSPFKDKIVHVVHRDEPVDNAWTNETAQRNAIMDGLKQVNMQGNDIVFVCDLDEIWRPEIVPGLDDLQVPSRLVMDFYYYAFNCGRGKKWTPPAVARGRDVTEPQSFRGGNTRKGSIDNAGWHFSCLMTPERLREKLLRFSHTEYACAPYTDVEYLADRIKKRQNFLNDTFFTVTPLDAPRYVMENQEKFAEFIF